jgi:pimeloyl-ACP methyl ester carboxylesterase
MSSPRHEPSGLRRVDRPPLAAGPGRGRLLVLVHGAMDRATSFTRLMARLPDWEIVAYDRRGYGRSHHLGPARSFDEQIDDLRSVLDGRPAVAFGHSFGGDVVLATAARHPGALAAAVVWEPPLPWMPWWPEEPAAPGPGAHLDPEERAERFMRRMVGNRVWERLPAATRAQRRAEGDTLAAEHSSLAAGPAFDPERVRIPVIVGRGGRSQIHHRRSARELAATLPEGELVEIPDAGHGVHLTHPAEVADLIRRVASVTSLNDSSADR